MPKNPLQIEPLPEIVAREGWDLEVAPALWENDRGFTGKSFARLNAPGGPLCLRRLPPSTSISWLRAIHAAVDFLGRRGFRPVPQFTRTDTGESLVRHHGQLYDLSEWAMGDPVAAADLSPLHLSNLGEAIGRLHRAGAGANGPIPRIDWLPGRIRQTMRLAWDPTPRSRDGWQHLENISSFFRELRLTGPYTEGDSAAVEVVAVANDALDWLAGMDPLADLAADPPTLTHGDLWSDHVRFAGLQVASLVDLDTLAVRPPMGDLAALCADFAGWDPQRCRAVLAGYRNARGVSPDKVAALPRLGGMRVLGVLRERLRAWIDSDVRRESAASLSGPVPYWIDQLRTLIALDVAAFGRL